MSELKMKNSNGCKRIEWCHGVGAKRLKEEDKGK